MDFHSFYIPSVPLSFACVLWVALSTCSCSSDTDSWSSGSETRSCSHEQSSYLIGADEQVHRGSWWLSPAERVRERLPSDGPSAVGDCHSAASPIGCRAFFCQRVHLRLQSGTGKFVWLVAVHKSDSIRSKISFDKIWGLVEWWLYQFGYWIIVVLHAILHDIL